MKQFSLMRKLILAGIFLVLIAATAYAENKAQPGSADDPIVTKSYVDEQMALLRKQLGVGGTVPSSAADAGKTLKVEKLLPGQKLIGKEGSEFIVRSGKTKVVAGENGDGIPDITDGVDLAGGQAVPNNHLLLIPRTDNRGIIVEAGSNDVYVIIRGGYEIK
jgi:hypothetical protein